MMDISEKGKKDIMTSLLEALSDLTDEAYLQRVWVEAKGPEVDDFDEFTNNYLHEFKSIAENHEFFGLTEIQYQKWKNFYQKYHYFCYNNKYDDRPELFINSPEWREIMSLAHEVLKAFDYKRNPNWFKQDQS